MLEAIREGKYVQHEMKAAARAAEHEREAAERIFVLEELKNRKYKWHQRKFPATITRILHENFLRNEEVDAKCGAESTDIRLCLTMFETQPKDIVLMIQNG